MTARILILLSAIIVGLLGTIHLLLTFRGPKLRPRDHSVQVAMENVHLGVTTQTTMWRAWIGFNASHSLGALLFSFIYGYLALQHPSVLFASAFLQIVGLAMLASFVLLARAYWFATPFAGTSLALVCFITGIGVAWV